MNSLFALAAIFTITMGDQSVSIPIQDQHCDASLRQVAEALPDADLQCLAVSPRPIARPDGLIVGAS